MVYELLRAGKSRTAKVPGSDNMREMILTLNAGSSSVKFALFSEAAEPEEQGRGQIEGIGAAPELSASFATGPAHRRSIPSPGDHASALGEILSLTSQAFPQARIRAVGHRIVHGGPAHAAPADLTPAVCAELDRLVPFAPLHQPHNLAGVAAARAAFPGAVQIGCFDTAFHRSQPRVNETFALPDRYYERGVRRYGFHGLSYAYVAGRLAEIAPERAAGRVVIAHLGNGASVAGLRGGLSQGCSMGFSPLDGLVMGTRTGQIDPAVLLYLMEEEGRSASEIADLLYKRSGLLGLSGLSNDMRRLEASGSESAARAVHHFVMRTAREIAAMAALIGGLDTLVFTGGIGEHGKAVRGRIVGALDWLGLRLDPAANRNPEGVVTLPSSRATAYVIPTDEERTIARAVANRLAVRRERSEASGENA